MQWQFQEVLNNNANARRCKFCETTTCVPDMIMGTLCTCSGVDCEDALMTHAEKNAAFDLCRNTYCGACDATHYTGKIVAFRGGSANCDPADVPGYTEDGEDPADFVAGDELTGGGHYILAPDANVEVSVRKPSEILDMSGSNANMGSHPESFGCFKSVSYMAGSEPELCQGPRKFLCSYRFQNNPDMDGDLGEIEDVGNMLTLFSQLDGRPCFPECNKDGQGGRRLSEEYANASMVVEEPHPPTRLLLTGDGDGDAAVAAPDPEGRRAQADDDDAPWSRFPGDARDSRALPNVQQILIANFDDDSEGKPDIFLHAPALSPGSCAQRCHSLGRFGYDSFMVHRAGFTTHYPQEDVHEQSYCYCGPHYDTMLAPHPPPSPPKPPPSPLEPPSVPPAQSPAHPPPSPPFPIYRAAGM